MIHFCELGWITHFWQGYRRLRLPSWLGPLLRPPPLQQGPLPGLDAGIPGGHRDEGDSGIQVRRVEQSEMHSYPKYRWMNYMALNDEPSALYSESENQLIGFFDVLTFVECVTVQLTQDDQLFLLITTQHFYLSLTVTSLLAVSMTAMHLKRKKRLFRLRSKEPLNVGKETNFTDRFKGEKSDIVLKKFLQNKNCCVTRSPDSFPPPTCSAPPRRTHATSASATTTPVASTAAAASAPPAACSTWPSASSGRPSCCRGHTSSR